MHLLETKQLKLACKHGLELHKVLADRGAPFQKNELHKLNFRVDIWPHHRAKIWNSGWMNHLQTNFVIIQICMLMLQSMSYK